MVANAKPKKNSLSREQAAQLYDDLKQAVTTLQSKKGSPDKPGSSAARATAEAISAALKGKMQDIQDHQSKSSAGYSDNSAPARRPQRGWTGQRLALAVVLTFAASKVGLSAFEASGLASVSTANASLQSMSDKVRTPQTPFSKEEVAVLTSLDARRAELEERSKRIDQKELDMETRDREYTLRLTQMKELTGQLKNDRDKNEKKRNTQLEQLANVYGSMNPPEAAALMEQLDVTIALGLIEKMPEKRIGQILSLMHPERALSITRMLSGKVETK